MGYLIVITCEEKFLLNDRWMLLIIDQSCKKKHGLLSDWKGNVRLYLVWAIMKYRLTPNLTMSCASNTD